MTREQKAESIEQLKQKFAQHEIFMGRLFDLTVEQVSKFRGLCFAKH
jgi:hypothetical protein